MNEMLHAFPISRLGVGQLCSFSFCPLSTLNGFRHPVSYSQYSSSLRVSNPSIMKCQGFTYWFNFLEVDYWSHPERVKNLIGIEDWVPWSLPPSLVRVTVSSCIKKFCILEYMGGFGQFTCTGKLTKVIWTPWTVSNIHLFVVSTFQFSLPSSHYKRQLHWLCLHKPFLYEVSNHMIYTFFWYWWSDVCTEF